MGTPSVKIEDRRRRFIQVVRERGRISMVELAQELDTTEVTARRDLRVLEAEGLVRRIYGGAASPALGQEAPHRERAVEPTANKRDALAHGTAPHGHQDVTIARTAARYVSEGDVVAIGGGSITKALAEELVGFTNLTVVTNSYAVCSVLIDTAVTVLASGGTLDGETQAFVGPLADQALQGLFVNKLFISGVRLNAERGLGADDQLAAMVDKTLVTMAAEVTVMVESINIGPPATLQTAPIARIDRVITDRAVSYEAVRDLEHADIEVVIAEI